MVLQGCGSYADLTGIIRRIAMLCALHNLNSCTEAQLADVYIFEKPYTPCGPH